MSSQQDGCLHHTCIACTSQHTYTNVGKTITAPSPQVKSFGQYWLLKKEDSMVLVHFFFLGTPIFTAHPQTHALKGSLERDIMERQKRDESRYDLHIVCSHVKSLNDKKRKMTLDHHLHTHMLLTSCR